MLWPQLSPTSGNEVWITDIDQDALQSCPASWRKSCVDVANDAQMSALFDEIAAVWGTVDVVCANAGVAGPTAKVEDVGWADWNACVSTTLGGAFLSAKYAAPLMKRRRQGRTHLGFLNCRPIRLPKSRSLCGGKMGGDRPDENSSDGAGTSWHTRQCDLPGGG